MASTTITSREFNRDTGAAKRAADRGPVIITDRGHPAHVLLTFDSYQRLAGSAPSIVDVLADPDAAAVELVAPRDRRPARPHALG
jgi:prevent-host-death family protein